MALLLHIDTALEHGGVCISQDDVLIAVERNTVWQQHASFLQPAIQKLYQQAGFSLKDTAAITVSNGPGSYTGLRVGLASAKGLCFALDLPLILINTLEIMAASFRNSKYHDGHSLLCPMIDARRMEVYTALYDNNLRVIVAPEAVVVDNKFLQQQFQTQAISFFGNGSDKLKAVFPSLNDPAFASFNHNTEDMIALASKAYRQQEFASVAYSEPFYLKPFFTKGQV